MGQPRTGTHALHALLNQHPDVLMSTPKEPVYFATDLHEESDAFHHRQRFFYFRDESHYLDIFKDADDKKYAGESTAVYLVSRKAAENLYRFNPEAKIIMIFREPVSWLQSFHSEACHCLGEQKLNLKDAIESEKERRAWQDISMKTMAPSLLYYSEYLKYTEQIERYFQYFDRSAVKIIIYNDFQKNNMGCFQDILGFLGLEPDNHIWNRKINASKTKAKFPLIQNILQLPELQKLAIHMFPAAIYQKLVRFYWEKMFIYKAKEGIDPAFRRQLMKRFKPEVEKLSVLLNRDTVALWGYDKLKDA